MEHILTALYLAVFVFIIGRLPLFRVPGMSQRPFQYIFILKVGAGVFLGLLYKYYFNGGDTHVYFRNAEIMYGFASEDLGVYFKMLFAVNDPALKAYYDQMLDWDNLDYFYNDSHTIVRLNALMRIFSFGVYNVHVIFFSFLSLIGLTCLYRCFLHFLPRRRNMLLAGVFLVPSVLCWSSGILKEGLLMFGMGVLFYSNLQMIHAGKKYYALPAVIAIMVLMFLKVYVLILLFPGIVAWLWSVHSPPRLVVLKFCLTYGALVILLLGARWINPNLNAVSVLYWKQVNSVKLAEAMQSRSSIEPPAIEPSFLSLVLNAPEALFRTFWQPSFAQVHNPFAIMAAAENALMLLALILTAIFYSRPPPGSLQILLVCVFFTASLYILVGFTTATAGSLVRYKMPALPFLAFILISLSGSSRPRKLKESGAVS